MQSLLAGIDGEFIRFVRLDSGEQGDTDAALLPNQVTPRLRLEAYCLLIELETRSPLWTALVQTLVPDFRLCSTEQLNHYIGNEEALSFRADKILAQLSTVLSTLAKESFIFSPVEKVEAASMAIRVVLDERSEKK